jgi:hypothetical protein
MVTGTVERLLAVDAQNTYAQHPTLEALPPLVLAQRRHANKIATVAPIVALEKETRSRIRELLEAAGIAPGDGVTCRGYDVKHCDRKGNTTLDEVALVLKLVALGVSAADAVTAIEASMKDAERPKWAEVAPMKGAKVRT